MAARSPLMTYPVAVKLHPGLSDLQQVGVSSVQRAALAAHGRPGTTQRDPHWRAWTSSSLPSRSPGFSCWSQPRGCSPWQGTPPSRRRPTRSASGIEEIEREALATRKYLFRLAVRNWGAAISSPPRFRWEILDREISAAPAHWTRFQFAALCGATGHAGPQPACRGLRCVAVLLVRTGSDQSDTFD